MTAAVITSSIGRDYLKQSIESVINQTYPCHHYVFVNGPEWHEPARAILNDYPGVTSFYLPTDTGDYGMGPGCGPVHAGGAYMTNADVIFFLNDDDFFEPNHVELLMKMIKENDLGWAYSLRRFVDLDGSVIVDDDFDSLGFWPPICDASVPMLVDNSCYAIRRELIRMHGYAFTFPYFGDRVLLQVLKNTGASAGCTGVTTVNYRVGGSAPVDRNSPCYVQNPIKAKKLYPNGFPWRVPTVFKNENNGNGPWVDLKFNPL